MCEYAYNYANVHMKNANDSRVRKICKFANRKIATDETKAGDYRFYVSDMPDRYLRHHSAAAA